MSSHEEPSVQVTFGGLLKLSGSFEAHLRELNVTDNETVMCAVTAIYADILNCMLAANDLGDERAIENRPDWITLIPFLRGDMGDRLVVVRMGRVLIACERQYDAKRVGLVEFAIATLH